MIHPAKSGPSLQKGRKEFQLVTQTISNIGTYWNNQLLLTADRRITQTRETQEKHNIQLSLCIT